MGASGIDLPTIVPSRVFDPLLTVVYTATRNS